MSGENESRTLTAKDALKEFESLVDKYETDINLLFPKCQPSNIESALNLTEQDLNQMNSEECGAKAHTLSQYILYLQKEINRNTIRVNWAKNKMNLLIAAKFNEYGDKYTKVEIKMGMLCKENTYAAAINGILQHAEARITSLTNITMHVSLICNTLMSLQTSKRKQYHESIRTN